MNANDNDNDNDANNDNNDTEDDQYDVTLLLDDSIGYGKDTFNTCSYLEKSLRMFCDSNNNQGCGSGIEASSWARCFHFHGWDTGIATYEIQ